MKIKINKNIGDDKLDIYLNDILLKGNTIEINDDFKLKIVQHRLSSSRKDTFKALRQILFSILLVGRASYGNELASPAHAEWNGECNIQENNEGLIEITTKVCDGSTIIEVKTDNITVVDYTTVEKFSKEEKTRWLLMILCFLIPWTSILGYALILFIRTLFTDSLDKLSMTIIYFFIAVFFVVLIYGWINTYRVYKVRSTDKKNQNIDYNISKANKLCKKISAFAILSSLITIVLLIIGPFVLPNGDLIISLLFNAMVNIICILIVSNIKDNYHNSSKNSKFIIWIISIFILSIIVMFITLNFYNI